MVKALWLLEVKEPEVASLDTNSLDISLAILCIRLIGRKSDNEAASIFFGMRTICAVLTVHL
jgi:hypothetical protein